MSQHSQIPAISEPHPEHLSRSYQMTKNGRKYSNKPTTRAAALVDALAIGNGLEESLGYAGLSLETVCASVAYASELGYSTNYPRCLEEPYDTAGAAQLCACFAVKLGIVRVRRELYAWQAETLKELDALFAYAAELAPLFEWTPTKSERAGEGSWLRVRYEAEQTAFADPQRPEEQRYLFERRRILDSLGLDFLGRPR